ncbi:MAG: CRTAC1 family protein [Acidobacteriota bacterium]|jgi:hypothetical protein
MESSFERIRRAVDRRRRLTRRVALLSGLLLATGGLVVGGVIPRFEEESEAAGIDFLHTHGGTSPIVIYEQIPPGGAWLDYDGDGDLDLFTVQSGHRRFPPAPGEAPPSHRLYRNDSTAAQLSFRDVTATAGVGTVAGYGMGAVAADLDNDRDIDLYVTAYGPNTLFLNLGDGTFRDVTAVAGVGDDRMSSSAAIADLDGDGLQDLYVSNYVDYASGPEFCNYNGIHSGCSDLEYDGLPNSFYRNLGPGKDGIPRFQDEAERRGILDPEGRGLGVVTADLDGSGTLDLYLANDGGGNRMFLNDGNGNFEDATLLSGAGYGEAGLGEAGMGTDAGDFDGDGQLDIFVTNYARETNALYRNDGFGLFAHQTVSAGLAGPSFVPLGWGTGFYDFDLDGLLDLFVANGHVYDVCHKINPQDTFAQRNQLFLNNGKGGFEDVGAAAGPGLQVMESSRGAAFGDVDNDGDIDIWVANLGARGSLLMNRTGREGRHFLTLAVVGDASGHSALGARAVLLAADRRQIREVKAGGSYLSSSDPRLHFGLGESERVDRIEVGWSSGARIAFRDLPADRLFRIAEPPEPVP